MIEYRCFGSRALVWGCSTVAMLFAATISLPAHAVLISDDFNGAPFDYGGEPTNANGTFTAGPVGIWEGSWNMANLAGGSFDANFTDANALHVDDNNVTNVGWEGGRSSAPLLWTTVPAGQDFTATIKINAQTSGFWSAAGLIARAANSPTPPGAAAGDNGDENFVTATTFRTDTVNTNEGNTLNKRIEAGAQVSDNNIVIGPLVNDDPLPQWVRLERVGGGTAYRTWASNDGVNFQFQSRVIPTVGNALRDASVAIQVGPAYQNYGGSAGSTTFDDFSLDIHDPLAAPGAPNLSASQLSFIAHPGDVILQLITNSTPGEGPLSWVRVADPANPVRPTNPPTVSSLSAMLPGAQGGATAPPLPAFPADGTGSYFRWDTTTTMAGPPNVLPKSDWLPGIYK